ncbi:MAG: hypothetical protein D8B56_01915 [Alloprevotella sp.]|nr:MAG: hypothetical protein D8B56_01915 [Alloprevotella sp.]
MESAIGRRIDGRKKKVEWANGEAAPVSRTRASLPLGEVFCLHAFTYGAILLIYRGLKVKANEK